MKEIPLTKGKVALVDDEDFEYLSQWKWIAFLKKGIYYAQRQQWVNGRNAIIPMHRAILNNPDSEVDHRDRNGLNNQRANLRLCTRSQNTMNRGKPKHNKSGYKGVRTVNGYIRAEIGCNGQRYYLGNFPDLVTAAKAYDAKAKELHGEFACLNFPD